MAHIGILHPGAMGVSVAAAMSGRGHDVRWVAAGRSAATHARAREAGLAAVADVATLADHADVIVSVVPPAAAAQVADRVLAAGFAGTFVDANAVSPRTARDLAQRVAGAGGRFVDGGLVGPPAWRPGTTRLFLSGDDAATVAGLLTGSPLETVVIAGGPGAASAVKAAYAGWTKGSSALLLAVRALARSEGVEEVLLAEWDRSLPGLARQSADEAARIHRKAWRFEGEMREIAVALAGAGLPDGFHTAAADVYARLAGWRDRGDDQPVDAVVDRVAAPPDRSGGHGPPRAS